MMLSDESPRPGRARAKGRQAEESGDAEASRASARTPQQEPPPCQIPARPLARLEGGSE
jgi:hypothetical protein